MHTQPQTIKRRQGRTDNETIAARNKAIADFLKSEPLVFFPVASIHRHFPDLSRQQLRYALKAIGAIKVGHHSGYTSPRPEREWPIGNEKLLEILLPSRVFVLRKGGCADHQQNRRLFLLKIQNGIDVMLLDGRLRQVTPATDHSEATYEYVDQNPPIAK